MGASTFAKPEWADRITKFREREKLSQAALAKRLNVSPMAPSRWERGINEPSSEIYMQLGKMAGDPDCWYFWQRGGLSREDINSVVSGFGGGSSELRPARVTASTQKEVRLSLAIRSSYHATTSNGEFLEVPSSWCPNSAQTICVRVHEDGMAPIIGSGFAVVIDTSVTDPSQLENTLVAVLDRNDSIFVRCFARYGATDMLIGENRSRQPIPYNARESRIIGKVLWWIGQP